MSGNWTPKVTFLKSTNILRDSERDLVSMEQRGGLTLKKINSRSTGERKGIGDDEHQRHTYWVTWGIPLRKQD